MIKRLIFDVDGTLITNIKFVEPATKTLKKLGIYSKVNLEKFLSAIKTYEKHYNNYNTNDYIKHFSQSLEVELSKKFVDIFFEELKYAIAKKNRKIQHTISDLAKEYELVLLTNYFKESQLNRLNNMGIGKYFSKCYGEELIKPNSDAYINACGNNKLNECVMIGDDILLDIIPAQKIGLKTIFVNSKNISKIDIDTLTVNTVLQIDSELINKL